MILVIFLYATGLLLSFSGSALVVYFTLFLYFYIVDETPKFSRTPKFLRRTPRDTP
jgi:hypothetical protein